MAAKPSNAKQPVKKPVKPRGKASQQSEAQLDAATSAPVMRSKADAAVADWKKNAPKKFANLLDAKTEP